MDTMEYLPTYDAILFWFEWKVERVMIKINSELYFKRKYGTYWRKQIDYHKEQG